MWVFEEIINGRRLSEIINQEHENVKYLPGYKIPKNVVSWKKTSLFMYIYKEGNTASFWFATSLTPVLQVWNITHFCDLCLSPVTQLQTPHCAEYRYITPSSPAQISISLPAVPRAMSTQSREISNPQHLLDKKGKLLLSLLLKKEINSMTNSHGLQGDE